jgi:NAD(P)-dependent dehydrogenase (short-subunit alcohol dehydrogenase family)
MPFRGKTALVTGSTDGLGREIARTLAAGGAHVIIHGRNAERGRAVVDEIAKQGKGSARFIAADFASLAAVRMFADSIARLYPRLDLLVNNAGISIPRGQPRQTSADGHEMHMAVNYLPGWILVHRLRPALQAAAPSRVINVASRAQSPIDFTDVMLEKPGAFQRGYGQSKLAQISMTVELAPEFQQRGITMVALHPASMMNTAMVRAMGVEPRSTVDEGLTAVMNLVTMRTLEPGGYYNGTAPASPHPHAQDAAARAQLRALSVRLTGVK